MSSVVQPTSVCLHEAVPRVFDFLFLSQTPFECERTIRPEADPLSLLCHVLFASRGLRTVVCRESVVIDLPSVSLDKRTSTLVPHNRLASCRERYSRFSAPVTYVPSCCWMPCRHHGSTRCRVDPKRDLSVPLF